MKIKSDKKEIEKSFIEFVGKTIDTSKKVALDTKSNVSNAIEKTKNNFLMKKLKKLSPVFPEQYQSSDFNLPNIIMIVDDAVRKGNKLCEGAIGWLSKDTGVEMLYLYDEAIEFSKIQFVPAPICDAIYYVDSFDRNRFIHTDFIFSKAHEEKVAELKHIAYCLGAKKCSIEIIESQIDVIDQKRNISVSESVYKKDVQKSTEISFKKSEK